MWERPLREASTAFISTLNKDSIQYQLERLNVEESAVFGGNLFSFEFEFENGGRVNSEFLFDVTPKFQWLGVTSSEDDEGLTTLEPSFSSLSLKGPLQLNFATRDGVELFLPKQIETGSIITRVEIGHGVDNITLLGANEIELMKPVDISQISKSKKSDINGNHFKIQLKQAPILRIGGSNSVALLSPSKLHINSKSRSSSMVSLSNPNVSQPVQSLSSSTQLLQQNGKFEFEVEGSFLESLHKSLQAMHNNQLPDSMAANMKIKRVTEATIQPVNYFTLSLTLRDRLDGSTSRWRADLLRNPHGQNRIVGAHKQDIFPIQDTFSPDLFRNETGLMTIDEFHRYREKELSQMNNNVAMGVS